MGGMLAEGMAWGTGDALARSAFGGGYGYHSSGGGAADTGGSAVDAADTDGAPVDSGAVGPDPTVMNSTKTNEWGDVVDSNTNEWGDQIDSSSNGNVNEWGDPVDSGGGDGGGSGWDDLFSAAQDVFFDDDE